MEIYGIKYKVNQTLSEIRDDPNMGRCDTKMGLIKIKKDMPDDIKFATLVHEIVEILVDNNDLGIDHKTVSILSTGLSDVLLKNDIYRVLDSVD